MKIILTLLLSLIASISAYADNHSTETLHYKVIYRWGLVNKQTGRATFVLKNVSPEKSRAVMFARTEPWADKFFRVRDTLISVFDTETRLPSVYNRIAHEGGRYAKDIVSFTKSGNTTSAICRRTRLGKKATVPTISESSLSAEGDAVDLLSSFYYLRHMDFKSLNAGHTKQIYIFSGKKKEILKITYHGIENIKIDSRTEPTYKVTFTFTSDQGKTTSKPIKAWISTAPGQIPLKIEGELKIGKVQCLINRQSEHN